MRAGARGHFKKKGARGYQATAALQLKGLWSRAFAGPETFLLHAALVMPVPPAELPFGKRLAAALGVDGEALAHEEEDGRRPRPLTKHPARVYWTQLRGCEARRGSSRLAEASGGANGETG